MFDDKNMKPVSCSCTTCERIYVYDRRKGHTKTQCNSCRANRRTPRETLKLEMVVSTL